VIKRILKKAFDKWHLVIFNNSILYKILSEIDLINRENIRLN